MRTLDPNRTTTNDRSRAANSLPELAETRASSVKVHLHWCS